MWKAGMILVCLLYQVIITLDIHFNICCDLRIISNISIFHFYNFLISIIIGLRRRGYPAESIKLFCDRIGISRAENNIEMEVFEETIREYLDENALRIFAVINPLKVKIINLPDNHMETFTIENHPKRPELGQRDITFSNELYIDQADFFDTGVDGTVQPPKGYKRLVPDGTVRLKYAYVLKCEKVIRNETTNEVIELLCSYDKDTINGNAPAVMKKPKGIIQWVSKQHAIPIHMNIYDRLFLTPNPGKDQPEGDFILDLNPDSKRIEESSLIENSILKFNYGSVFQFERVGYFYLDPISNSKIKNTVVANIEKDKRLIFNRVVTLKDTWQQASTDSISTSKLSSYTTTITTTTGVNSNLNSKLSNFNKLDIRIGEILAVENHPNADSLYVTKINCGDSTGPRTVVSGLVKYFKPEELIGKKVITLCNLKPSKLRGIVSEGMILTSVIKEQSDTTSTMKLELIEPTTFKSVGDSITLPIESSTCSSSSSIAPSTSTQSEIISKANISKDVWEKISVDLKINANKMLSFDEKVLISQQSGSTLTTSSFSNTSVQ